MDYDSVMTITKAITEVAGIVMILGVTGAWVYLIIYWVKSKIAGRKKGK